MQSTQEPQLPDPVPATRDPVTPDLPVQGLEAPDIRIAGSARRRTSPGEEDGESQKDAEEQDEAPAAAPARPEPQEPTD
ncbi:hypothetical protein EDD98_6139 [Streptomyces sp. PanSC19]|uniref:hypothetical protein n=1 Tax=Streptomyces sp. PanSC19 TaxID=1520455 RepID=UPI000F491DF7|nr:hypothetical protein [Streptomyces sp. PanSC19]ROQ26505.1 hypothetical protein EDD98_6139 [Streptomyces sp. PanSC19]